MDPSMDPPSADPPRSNRDSKRVGGRGGKGKDRPPPSRETQVSKKLSWLLRHGATSENLALDAGGYANLADVLGNRNLRGMKVSFEEVRGIVAGNDKQRFGMKLASCAGEGGEVEGDETSSNPKDWMIRANQGHSIKVESEGLLEPITLENMPETVVHGTSHGAWTQIVASGGLKPMGRNHIHFASGLPATFKPLSDTNASSSDNTATTPEAAQAPVISGMRNSSTILIYLDLRKALESGIKFWRSENGVVLSEGKGDEGDDGEGKVGLEFFARVEDRTGEGVLVEEGKVVKEAPESWAVKGKGGGRGQGRGRGRGGRCG